MVASKFSELRVFASFCTYSYGHTDTHRITADVASGEQAIFRHKPYRTELDLYLFLEVL